MTTIQTPVQYEQNGLQLAIDALKRTVSASVDADGKLLDLELAQKINGEISELLVILADASRAPALKWAKDAVEEKVYSAQGANGSYRIAPKWSTLYENRVDFYRITFWDNNGSGVALGTEKFDARHFASTTAQIEQGEKLFNDAKKVAALHSWRTR